MLKSILSNTLAQLVAKFFGAGLTLLTTYYMIRLAGLDQFGDFTKIVVIVAIGFTAIDFGLNAEAIRHASSNSKMLTLTRNLLYTRLFLALCAIILLNLGVYYLPGGYSHAVKSLFWLGSLSILFQSVFTSGNAYFQYTTSYWRSTLAIIVGAVTTTLFSLYYLATTPSLAHLVFANTLGYVLMALTTLSLLPRRSLTNHISIGTILQTLSRAKLLGAILIASIISSKIDTILLGVFRTSSEVGQYGFAYRIFDVILVLPVFVMNSLYPLMVQAKQSFLTRTLKSLGLLGFLAAIFTYLAAPLLLYIRPDLGLAVLILRLLALSLPLFYLTAPLMWELITNRRDHQVFGIYVNAIFVNLLSNLWLIPRYGAPAAAITTGITELFIFLVLLYYSLRTYD